MKKIKPHTSLSIFLQVLGILVNGILGMGLEMIGLFVLNLKNKKTLISLLKKLVFVIVSQILIDLIFGNDSMMVEMILLYLEKMNVVIFAIFKICIGILIFSQKKELNKYLIKKSFHIFKTWKDSLLLNKPKLFTFNLPQQNFHRFF